MIMEHIDGTSLTEAKLSESSEHCRRQFYTELIGILGQLRGLDFDAAGSLMPGWFEGLSNPVVLDPISIPISDLRLHGHILSSPPARSSSELIALQQRVL